jgi:hypothetical protein
MPDLEGAVELNECSSLWPEVTVFDFYVWRSKLKRYWPS